jgi:hypothetical protein
MYLYVINGINLPLSNDFSIVFWNCSDSVTYCVRTTPVDGLYIQTIETSVQNKPTTHTSGTKTNQPHIAFVSGFALTTLVFGLLTLFAC